MKFTADIDASDLPDAAKCNPERFRKFADRLEDLLGLPQSTFTERQQEFLLDSSDRVHAEGEAMVITDRQYGWVKGLYETHVQGDRPVRSSPRGRRR